MSLALAPRAETLLNLARRQIDAAWLAPALALLDGAMQQDGGHDFGHLLRVLANARRIHDGEVARSPAERPSWDAIAAAVLFHDVVNLPKNHPERHLTSTLAAHKAAQLLGACPEFPAALLPSVAEAIRVHSFSSGFVAQTLEAQIVTDADRLESLGAFGIARTFYVSGALGRSLCDLADPFAEHRPRDDREFGLDHFYVKLLRLRELLYTATARELAASRHALMETFLAGLREELP